MATEIDALPTSKSIGWTDALLSRLAANSVGLGARLSITAPANASALSSTGYSLTGSNASSMIDLAGTWNTTGTPTAIKLNVTNTASNAASLLMDLQVGGVSKLKVATTGLVQFVDADVTGMSFTSTGSYGFKYFSLADAGRISMLANSSEVVAIGSGGINIGTNAIGFGANFLTASRDVFLLRDGAANTLALRNAANAQAFNIYGTYTSASVYERGAVYADSNGFNIAHQQLGATKRPVRILGHNLDSAEAVSALEINQTWNTTGNPVALKLAITNAASGATSKFVSFLAGASGTTEVFSVDKNGVVLGAKGTAAVPGISFVGDPNTGMYSTNSDQLYFAASGQPLFKSLRHGADGGTIRLFGSGRLSWASSIDGADDLGIERDGPNTLALRNAANAQCLNIYGTYTSGSVYERMFARYSVANTRFEIGTEHTGASARDLSLMTNGTECLKAIASSGQILVNSALNIFTSNCRQWNQYGITLNGTGVVNWRASDSEGAAVDTGLKRTIAGVVGITNGSTGGGAIGMQEQTAPAALSANGVYIYAEDDGGGKTRLMARFATGSAVQIAIEP